MAAVQETDNLRDSPGTHGAVVGPRMAGGMTPACSAKLLVPPREVLRSSRCHYRSSIGRTERIGVMFPEFPGPRILRGPI
jgi:hypothetical protein